MRWVLLIVVFTVPGCVLLMSGDTPPFFRVERLPTPKRIDPVSESSSVRLTRISASKGYGSYLIEVAIESEEEIVIEPVNCTLCTRNIDRFSVAPAVVEVIENGKARVLATEKVLESDFLQNSCKRTGWVQSWQRPEHLGAIRLAKNTRATFSFIFFSSRLEDPEFFLTVHSDEDDREYRFGYRICSR